MSRLLNTCILFQTQCHLAKPFTLAASISVNRVARPQAGQTLWLVLSRLGAAASAMWTNVGETHRHLITSLARQLSNDLHLCSITRNLIVSLSRFVFFFLFALLLSTPQVQQGECKSQWLSQSPRRSKSPRSVGSSTERTSCAPLSQPFHTGVCVSFIYIKAFYMKVSFLTHKKRRIPRRQPDCRKEPPHHRR